MKYTILVCLFLLIFSCGCMQPTVQHQISTPVPTPTPLPADIIGTWEGDINLGMLSSDSTYRITFHPNHVFEAKPLTSDGSRFSGTWKQCITDVECLPSEWMYQKGQKYSADHYVLQFNLQMFGQSTTIDDIVLLKDGTLNYRGTQHKV